MIGPGLRWVIEACRAGDLTAADIFSQGASCAESDLAGFVPTETLADLDANRLIERRDGTARLTIRCNNFNNLVSIMPAEQKLGADFVHLNADTMWLVRLVWKHATPGITAVELGTGNGIVAAHLVARYRRVLATDLPGPWLRYAQLTLEANAGRGRPSAVVACDVASALRPRSFDLVAANTPWSPAPPPDDDGKEMTFMAGGDTGTELPARFLREGAELLRPGGTAIMLCFDPEFEDGSRPLVPVLDGLVADGYRVECVDSEVFEPDWVTERLRSKRLPTLKHGRHLAVIIRNPGDVTPPLQPGLG